MCVWFGDHIFYPNPTPKKHISCLVRCTGGLKYHHHHHLYALSMPQVEELEELEDLSPTFPTYYCACTVPVRTHVLLHLHLLVLYLYLQYLYCTYRSQRSLVPVRTYSYTYHCTYNSYTVPNLLVPTLLRLRQRYCLTILVFPPYTTFLLPSLLYVP